MVIMITITIIIKSHKIDTAKNKIAAPKRKLTRWLVNGFLSHEMFAFLIEERVPRRDAGLIFIAI